MQKTRCHVDPRRDRIGVGFDDALQDRLSGRHVAGQPHEGREIGARSLVAGVDAQHRVHGLAGGTDVAIPIKRHAEIEPCIGKPRRHFVDGVEQPCGAVQKSTGEIGDAERVMALRHGTAAQTPFAGSVDGVGYVAERQQGPGQAE